MIKKIKYKYVFVQTKIIQSDQINNSMHTKCQKTAVAYTTRLKETKINKYWNYLKFS